MVEYMEGFGSRTKSGRGDKESAGAESSDMVEMRECINVKNVRNVEM